MRALMGLVFASITGSLLAAQTGAQFEVASIKRHPEPITVSSDPSVSGNRVTSTASTLLDLITVAYGVKYDQISGGAAWVNSEHYDLAAKAEGEGQITKPTLREMLQALLADRFGLKIHRETKDVPAYALVVGRKGAKLIETSGNEPGSSFVRANASALHMEQANGTMGQLAGQLSITAGRPVVDKTNLTGHYKFKLDWTRVDQAGDPGSDTPDLFSALQEQLGLKLEPTRSSVDMLIIDQARKPFRQLGCYSATLYDSL